jgi:hypothetical protein
MTAYEIVERIKGRHISERAAARFIYDNFEPRPMQRQAADFSRFILSRLKAGINPMRIAELWCLQCWSANSQCACLGLTTATASEQALIKEQATEEQVRGNQLQQHVEFIREHGHSAWLKLIEERMKAN